VFVVACTDAVDVLPTIYAILRAEGADATKL
jgi:hypothetical protein